MPVTGPCSHVYGLQAHRLRTLDDDRSPGTGERESQQMLYNGARHRYIADVISALTAVRL